MDPKAPEVTPEQKAGLALTSLQASIVDPLEAKLGEEFEKFWASSALDMGKLAKEHARALWDVNLYQATYIPHYNDSLAVIAEREELIAKFDVKFRLCAEAEKLDAAAAQRVKAAAITLGKGFLGATAAAATLALKSFVTQALSKIPEVVPLILLALFLLPFSCGAKELSEDDIFYDLSRKMGYADNGTDGIDLPAPKDSTYYKAESSAAEVVSVEPAPTVHVEKTRAAKIAAAHELDDDANFKRFERDDAIKGIDLYRAPVKPALSKYTLSIDVGTTVKAIKRGRLQTREEALEGYVKTRVLNDERLHHFCEHSQLTGKWYKAALTELKTRLANEIRAELKSDLGLASNPLPFSSEALANFFGGTA